MLVGVDEEAVYEEPTKIADDNEAYAKMAKTINSYGDGHDRERIVDILESKPIRSGRVNERFELLSSEQIIYYRARI